MHGAFDTVLWVVCIVGAVIAVVALLSSRGAWRNFGKDGLVRDSELPSGAGGGAGSPAQEREEEIRQMLEARNARRARRGEQPVDVEREMARLNRPQVDAQLRAEIRDLVIARNYRRTRAGKPALDVEKEVEREIARLVG